MTRDLYILISAPVLSVLIILGLFLNAKPDGPIRDNSFARNFISDAIERKGVMDLEYNTYYFAGIQNDKIYLGNVTGYLHVLKTNTSLSDSSHIRIQIALDTLPEFRRPRVKIYPPYFYLTDGVLPALYRGSIGEWIPRKFMDVKSYFVEAKIMAPTKLGLKLMRSDIHEYSLAIMDSLPPYFKLKPGLLEKQIDGVFDVDGQFHYNQKLDRLVYVYYYRNEFFVTDSNLNLETRYRTIDTISRSRTKSTRYSSGNSMILASPPKLVNKLSASNGKLLYINSKIMGKNDDETKFKQASVIDVYDLTRGIYQFSFYLPGYHNKSAREIRLTDTALIALYDHYIVSYELNPKVFPNEDFKNILSR
ncbi:hypothetical protein [Sinomicrobium oceani]|uniref:hypothetical protein n=1 Tax=Sinomicrobium oceani TaxID=1150368 RepID=UPI00227CE52C|nr:hypothetical protein [Sinomicrobium oceani]